MKASLQDTQPFRMAQRMGFTISNGAKRSADQRRYDLQVFHVHSVDNKKKRRGLTAGMKKTVLTTFLDTAVAKAKESTPPLVIGGQLETQGLWRNRIHHSYSTNISFIQHKCIPDTAHGLLIQHKYIMDTSHVQVLWGKIPETSLRRFQTTM